MFVTCPICAQRVQLCEREADSVETHGFDTGPFERFHDEWYECPACGARLTEEEVEAILI